MSPANLPHLDRDYAELSQSKIDARMAQDQKVIDIANELLRCGDECETKGFPCDMCGNPRCKKAWKDKLKLEEELGLTPLV